MTSNADPPADKPERTLLERLSSLDDELLQRIEAFSETHPLLRRTYLVASSVLTGATAQAASAMAFDLFLATIPMLALGGWVYGRILHSSGEVISATSSLLDLTPRDVHALVLTHLDHFSGRTVAPFALLGALWLASSAFHTSMSLFEVVAGAVRRPWWKKRALSLACVVIGLTFIASGGSLAVAIAGSPAEVLELFTGDEAFGATLSGILLLVLCLCMATALLAWFYRIAVDRPTIRRRIWPGAIAAVLSGGSASFTFAYYAYHMARYALFYGSLATVVITLAWLWLVCFTSLIGAELNFQLENAESGIAGLQPASPAPTQTPQPSGSSAEA